MAHYRKKLGLANLKEINLSSLKNGVVFSLFSFLNNGISFILLIILAKYLSPSSYGSLNLFNSLVIIFSVFVTLSGDGLLSVEYFKNNDILLKKLVNSVILNSIFILIIILFGVILVGCFLNIDTGINVIYQLIALFVCFFQFISNLALNFWRLEEKPYHYGIFSFLLSSLNCILSLLLIIYYKFDWEGRIFSQLFITFIFALFSLYILYKKGYLANVYPTKVEFNKIYRFGIPLIPHSLSFWLRQGLDRYIINYFHSATSVGYYSFALNLANILQIIGTAFNSVISVNIYKQLSKDSVQAKLVLKKQSKFMLILYFIFSVCLTLACVIVINVFFPKYLNAIKYIYPLICASYFHCFYLLYVNYIFYYKKTHVLMRITFIISILHVLCSLFLTRYSIYYTSLIMLTSNIFISICVYLYANKILKG